ncbi:FtsQ-type POTRA domain-containing protein [Sedimentibacter sp.]|uniref:cell division protein FtsQ/DivIB n=1 Tax=Sedimentibacter sp. TaxID=1960295 RepID=UPI00289E88C3|nr:FtsQ-type POTRA domain-containing protein [Sedimentibacter sp.]
MAKEKATKKRKKKKRKFRKLFVSTAAFITAAVIVVFCIYYVYYETDYFSVAEVNVDGNAVYDTKFIVDNSEIETGVKLFSIDRSDVKEKLQQQVYVEHARVVYELPNKIYIHITERQEKYQIFYNNNFIITDKNGIVLKTDIANNQLKTIESLTNVLYNVGEEIKFTDIDDVNSIFEAIDYIESEFDSETVTNLWADKNNSILLETKYGTFIKMKLSEDVKYQAVFAMKIINERLNNNLPVFNGLIDFTKGDITIYAEDFNMEEYNE